MIEYMIKELAIDGYDVTAMEVQNILNGDLDGADPIVVEYVLDMLNEWNGDAA